MSLAERLENWAPTVRNNCRTCAWYDKLSSKEKKAVDEFLTLIDSGQASRPEILAIFQEEGLDCAETSFSRHLKNCREPH